jgi:hypothetical protein
MVIHPMQNRLNMYEDKVVVVVVVVGGGGISAAERIN